MKVRHKLTDHGEMWDVLDEGKEYYILQSPKDVHGVSRIGHAKKTSVEIIPDEPRWQDVTGECGITNDGSFVTHKPFHSDTIILSIHGDDNCRDGTRLPYRLRRVHVVKGDWRVSEPVHLDAFIVERKVG